jgi:hypothetical protein
MIHPLAKELGVPADRVFANTILFHADLGPNPDAGGGGGGKQVRGEARPTAALAAGGAESTAATATVMSKPEPGAYAGFDPAALTSRDGGKAEVIRRLKARYRTSAEETAAAEPVIVMVGDGATDAQACPPADAFIGYGGVAERPVVRAAAHWYVTDFGPLLEALQQH